MRLITDQTEIDRRGAALLGRAGEFASVGGVVGTGFDAYARILHPVSRHDSGDDEVSWADVAAVTGATMHPQVQWWAVLGRRLDADHGDSYTVELPNGWHLNVEYEGEMPPALLTALTGVLRPFTTPDDVTVAIWGGWGELHVDGNVDLSIGQTRPAIHRDIDPAIGHAVRHGPHFAWPARDMILFDATLGELADPDYGYRARIWPRDWRRGPGPNMIWPIDLSWAVATEIDFNWTLVGGTRELIDTILADDRFEAFEVSETDEMTWASDTVN
ncbi:MAG: hypothetical protein QM728_06480 [Gordonia sp. (in: high G+C Gram-positive bacteria)]|uniref:hypothetical protein n=1 Tax=Gordonia sp. (in: high G+C Gram-positive bacteria) TaxID=84139 RepID=UPI0039E22E06